MTGQLAFDLPARPALGRTDFFVSAANARAVAALQTPGWPHGRMVLAGPAGAGKTHLAHVWAAEAGADIVAAGALPRADDGLARSVAVEDAPRIAGDRGAETALLHLVNWQAERGGRVLLTGRGAPARWGLTLPDLASRIAAAPLALLQAPDDALLAAVMVKLFADRQLHVAPAVIAFILRRIDRSFAAAESAVAALDAAALAEQRAVSRPLAAKVLDKPDAPSA